MRLLQFLCGSILSGITLFLFRRQMNLTLMKFFRNLGRYKARKRLYGNNAALMPLLLGNEELLEDLNKTECESFIMTSTELSEMDGRTETTPIYLAIKGRIYDVSEGRNMYGPGKDYHVFVGKDSSRAFSNGCMEVSCAVASLEGLDENALKEVDRWEDFYRGHDKYTCIGRLVEDHIDAVVDKELAQNS